MVAGCLKALKQERPPSHCSANLRKIITVDTPHRGSELANLIVDTSANRIKAPRCFEVLELVNGPNNMIFKDAGNTSLFGGFEDLSVGSDTQKNLPNFPSNYEWTAVAGIADNGPGYAYNLGVSLLWQFISWKCDKEPSDLLTLENDRIVSRSSQLGGAEYSHLISNVDHVSVIGNGDLNSELENIIEKNMR